VRISIEIEDRKEDKKQPKKRDEGGIHETGTVKEA